MVKITQEEFYKLTAYIKRQYGINIKEEKKELLVGRLYRTLEKMQMKSFSEYYDYMVSDKTGKAVNQLIDRITTNHTYFMRESSHFDFLRQEALPYWENRIADRDLRLWCAACASGEEAYTLAMVINEFLGKSKMFWDAKILATDLSRQVLIKAERGFYKREDIKNLPLEWQKAYFEKVDEEFCAVRKILRDEVIFRQFNLMAVNYPFKKPLHIIFCRNVMIYFDEVSKREVVKRFYDALAVGGYLFIGKSESLGIELYGFRYVCPSIYQKV